MNIASPDGATRQTTIERALASGDAATFPNFHADVASITRGVDRRSGGRSRPASASAVIPMWKASPMNHHTHLRYLAHVERYRVTKRELEMRRHRLALLERRGNASDAPVHPATQFRHPRPAPEHSE